ncbi:hypothetical protein MNBD_ALPHA09-140 [hydrothermal vent metagenome]|uniref:Uncharacterized protein n=1 Tax=hydrothermal vent metagenome TaxID=652676 RepID=A0A3B0T0M3_9ZZZZ
MTCIRCAEASRNVAIALAATSTSSRRRNSGFWVAIPAGQVLAWHIRAATQPMA